jgi:hypothetical protein
MVMATGSPCLHGGIVGTALQKKLVKAQMLGMREAVLTSTEEARGDSGLVDSGSEG